MSQQLIILGASVRAAAFSAIRAGFEPYAIDCYADRDLAAVCPAVKIDHYPRDFDAALAAAPDAPWMYTGGLENHPRLVGRLAKLRPLWGCAGKGLREVRMPERLAAAATVAGVCFPRTTNDVPAGEQPVRWLVKRRRSSGGLGVRFAPATETLSLDCRSYYQEHIEGQAASAVFVATLGRAVLLGASAQLLGRDVGIQERPFLYAGSIGPLPLSVEEAERLEALGRVLAERFGLRGLFGVDFVRSQDQLWLLEVNPRYTASVEVLEQATDARFLQFHAAACDGRVPPRKALAAASLQVGKQVVYARRDGTITSEFTTVVEELNRGPHPGIADLPRVGDAVIAGQPIATVFAQGASRQETSLLLATRAAAVQNTY